MSCVSDESPILKTYMAKHIKLLSSRYEMGKQSYRFPDQFRNDLIEQLKNRLEIDKSVFERHHLCPLCANQEFWVISETERYGLPLTMQICKRCGLIFSEKYFSPSFAREFYGNIYNGFRADSHKEQLEKRIDPSAYCWKRFQYVADVLQDKFREINVVMEPGCNDGCNLYPFMLNSAEVYGCDFDHESIACGRKLGLELLQGNIETLARLNKKADLIILSHVIAHIADPGVFLRQVWSLLRPGGYVYVETPGVRCGPRGKAKDFRGLLQFGFFFVFELTTIRALMERSDFSMIAGDEFVRALFVKCVKTGGGVRDDSTPILDSGRGVYRYLKNMENRFLVRRFFKWTYSRLTEKSKEE